VEKQARANRKIREGVVVSNKMKNTVVVLISSSMRHPLYKKVLKVSNKFKAHDEGNACGVGDKVRIMETRPMSADKRWVVLEILEKGKGRIEEEDKGMPAPVRRTTSAGSGQAKEEIKEEKKENDTN
jgi:small subunit ribosomal protein S17